MIIYGTGAKNFGAKKLKGVKCENCESSKMYITGYCQYAHIFWIPLFPTSKKIFTICENCEEELPKKYIPKKTMDRIKLEKSGFKTPIYLFSGLIIITMLIFYGIYSSNKHDEEVAKNIANLESKDVLVFKNDDDTYSFGKVEKVRNDTVFLSFSNYIFEGGSPSKYDYNREKQKVSDFYDVETYYFFQKTIDSMYSVGEIYDLFREEND
ncbi:MAG: hypothetical protein JXQ93_09060 [Flavobacteriaceae bacterium]